MKQVYTQAYGESAEIIVHLDELSATRGTFSFETERTFAPQGGLYELSTWVDQLWLKYHTSDYLNENEHYDFPRQGCPSTVSSRMNFVMG